MTTTGFRHNHYVPKWYQERFLPTDRRQRELLYFDKTERSVQDSRGHRRTLPAVSREPLKKCFAQRDLYTIWFGGISFNTLEKNFFGELDREGRKAVAFWGDYAPPRIDTVAFEGVLTFMGVQKLRTPKGLDWLAVRLGTRDPAIVLAEVVQLSNFFSSIWAECVWQIADASNSATKFIVSDHPVTVYNRVYSPLDRLCKGSGDPDIHLNGTHTIFPLSLDKILILTNRSWARNPYRSPEKERPHSIYERDTFFDFTDIQLGRKLDEQEVRAINFIIKSRAYRYVAAAEEEWLYPERHLPKGKWSRVGGSYLLMPDPRSLHHGGDVMFGYTDGSTRAFDVYGRTPSHPDFGRDSLPPAGRDPLLRFKGEFARMVGPRRRGWRQTEEKEIDTDDLHAYHLSLDTSGSRKRRAKSTTKKNMAERATEKGGEVGR